MITYYYQDEDGRIEPREERQENGWIHVEAPDEGEIAELLSWSGVPRKFVRAALDQREVARTDATEGSRMVIVRAPYDFGDDDHVPFRTVPLTLIATADRFITISRKPIDFVGDLNVTYLDDDLPAYRAARMIPAILGVVGEWYLQYLEEIEQRLEDIERRLMDSIENSEMLELLRVEKSLVYLKTGLEWNNHMLDRLRETRPFDWDETEERMLDDVLIEYQQGYHMAQTMLEVLESTNDSYASLISNNLNVVMKFLAAVTIILTLPMIVASIYGMNVPLPGENNPNSLMILMLGSAVVTLWVSWW
ncbi:MAG: magnesium transporter CorA family protein, partial [Acidobacteriota bacterium]